MQKHRSRGKEGENYHKWVIVIPDHVIHSLDWDAEWEKKHNKNQQVELEARARQGKIVIEKKE